MQKIIVFITGCIIGVVSGVLLLNNSVFDFNEVSESESAIDSQTLDTYFIEQMIPHHDDAVKISRLASEYARREEIKDLAQSIIADQSQEITVMDEMYRNMEGKTFSKNEMNIHNHGDISLDKLHMGTTGTAYDIERFKNEDNFDKLFLEHMITHHQMAVMMAEVVKTGTDTKEIQNLADTIIVTQNKEISQMQKWYTDWYTK
jgi:uncharacterized protein (DUF305 family)